MDKNICKNYPKLPNILPAAKRIICIGDLHGDYKLTLNCLKLAKIINKNLDWIAEPKDTIVVQIGDQIDKCRPTISNKCNDEFTTPKDEASDIKILKFFSNLNNKAIKHGGKVISLLGNHEIMNISGNMNYVSFKGLNQFKNIKDNNNNKLNGIDARKYFFRRGGKFSEFLACTRNTSIIIGSNLFVHAAIVPELAKNIDIENLNNLIKKWILNELDDNHKINGIGKLSDIISSYDISPFWPRILGNLPSNISLNDDICLDNLQETLDIYNVNNMIVGHTPQTFKNKKEGINVTCRDYIDGKNKGVWRIDVGSSSGFNNFKDNEISKLSKPQVLEILNDNKFNVLS